MKIPFSPPDITEEEVEQVAEALRSGWITTGPKTKELERHSYGIRWSRHLIHFYNALSMNAIIPASTSFLISA